jgi:hypothetical protein
VGFLIFRNPHQNVPKPHLIIDITKPVKRFYYVCITC